MRFSPTRTLAAAAFAAALAIGIPGLSSAPSAHAALATIAGDATNNAYAAEAIHAATWNVCGEAGGTYPGDLAADGGSSYCPDRNQPQVKATTIANAAKAHNLNVITLQEVCGEVAGTAPVSDSSSGTPTSMLDMVKSSLGAGWNFAWAPALRPGNTANAAGGSRCRAGLDGTLGIAVLVKGTIAKSRSQFLPNPDPSQHETESVMCAAVDGWTTEVCNVHMVNESYTSESVRPNDYDNEVSAVAAFIKPYPRVVLGGDFNTVAKESYLPPLYQTMAECDQQSFYPYDIANEPTHHDFNFRFGPNGSITDGAYDATKIDYLFATSGFSSCGPVTSLADQADYETSVQPGCVPVAPPALPACTPSGISDHAPLVGVVKGGPDLLWRLADGTATDSSGNGNTGTVAGGVAYSSDHGGSAMFDGTGVITTPAPVVNTTRSFTVSAWVKLAAGAPTSVIASQDGGYGGLDTIPNSSSGFALWYNQPDNAWHFGMPTSDLSTRIDDQAKSGVAAQPGVWTLVTGVFDAMGGTQSRGGLTIYVNGQSAGTADHTSLWTANGQFTVGRDISPATSGAIGAPNAYWHGSIQNVTALGYPMNAAEVSSFATKLLAPAATTTVPASDSGTPGCQPDGGYSTVHSPTPVLSAQVTDPDPSKPVHADFALWDNSAGGASVISLGGAGSAGSSVTGAGTSQVTTPALTSGHQYGWYARTSDGSGTSTTSTVCHFYAG